MSFTSEDQLKEMMLRVARVARPASEIRRERALRRAVSDDGYIKARAILPSLAYADDFDCSSVTASSSDTVTPAVYMTVTFPLSTGVWRVKAMGGLTGRLSGASTMNAYITLNGQESSNFQVPLAALDTGGVWPVMTLDAAQDDVQLDLLYRPSAGTLTIEAGYWRYKAERIS